MVDAVCDLACQDRLVEDVTDAIEGAAAAVEDVIADMTEVVTEATEAQG